MTDHDESARTTASAPVAYQPRPQPEQFGAWQRPGPGYDNPVVMRTMTEYRAAAWSTAPAAPYGFATDPDTPAGGRPRWFWPVVLTAGAVVALLAGGFGGFAIGHSIDVGSSQTQTTTPGTGQFPGGGTGQFPGGTGGTGTGTGGTGTGSTGTGSTGTSSGQNS